MTLTDISKNLNSHKKCIKYLEKTRWNGTPVCPYCSSTRSSKKQLRHTCMSCSNSYSVTVGTCFENSNLPLTKWFMAMAIILAAKKGVSSLQLARDLSVNKNTAWLMGMKIRTAMEDGSLEKFIARTKSSSEITESMSIYKVPSLVHLGFDKVRTLLKRAIAGQYHKIDSFYLLLYLNEISFKYERRRCRDNAFCELMCRMFGDQFAKL